jgi:opacity protein-like surface antigen
MPGYGKFLGTLLIGLASQAAFASINFGSFVVGLDTGPGWQSLGHTQTLTLAPDIVKTYTFEKLDNPIGNFELFLGFQKPLIYNLAIQVGLDLGITTDAEIAGDIWDDASLEFDNYTYKYDVRHKQIAFKAKLIADYNCWPILPWISATLGVGFNQAYAFSSTPLIFEALPTPNFTTKTISTFTYGIGVGFQYPIGFNPNWQFGVGYEFADWGKSQLGAIHGSSTNASLTVDHYYTSLFLINITYVAVT